jgi:hypothetical protein
VEYQVHQYCIKQTICNEKKFNYILKFIRDNVILGEMDDTVSFGYPLHYKTRNFRNNEDKIPVGAFINHPACVQFNIPVVKCNNIQLFGIGEGSYAICNDFVAKEKPCSLIFSFGVYDSVDFEVNVGKLYNCDAVHTFDPCTVSQDFMAKNNGKFPSFLHYHPYGISDHNHQSSEIRVGEYLEGGMLLYDFQTILSTVDHTGDAIFLLKMDIEGGEVMVLHDLIMRSPQILLRIENICMEVHWEETYNDVRLDHFVVLFDDILVHLVNEAGFKLYHESPRKSGSRQTICLTRMWREQY